MTDEEKAVETAAQALGLMKTYQYRVAFTTRTYANEQIEATSVTAAIAKLREMNISDDYGHYNDSGVEGDELITLLDEDGDELAELDMRSPGEPFSWTACELVKELAKDDGFKSERDAVIALRMWVAKAKEACANTNPVVRYEDNEDE